MKTHTFRTEQWFPYPILDVFDFFSNALNLEKITPPWLHFQVLTPSPIKVTQGSLIDYCLRLHGIPIKWQSEIAVWNPPHLFIDEQRRGPYSLWIHQHTFTTQRAGTLVRDEVEYAVRPNTLIHKLFIAPHLNKIFAHRQEQLSRIFG